MVQSHMRANMREFTLGPLSESRLATGGRHLIGQTSHLSPPVSFQPHHRHHHHHHLFYCFTTVSVGAYNPRL